MSVYVHRLSGALPEPLSHYLKALGIVRLVAEQADPGARAFWKDDRFVLVSALNEVDLLDFFLSRWAPTPLVTPWNGGSGFYPKDTKEGIDAIAASKAPRFEAYRETIALCRALVGDRKESPKKEEKIALIQQCRRAFAGPALAWLDAALVLTGEDGAQYPALLGTGGNDGRLDFTNNQMQRLCELFDCQLGAPEPDAAGLLRGALLGEPVLGLKKRAIGQFLPGNAGGVNQAAGYFGEALVNPWDYVLMLEGAIVLQVAALRRLSSGGLPQAAAPFAVRAQAGGYASACAVDESARGEQWMPLWERPASFSEIEGLFAEGRLSVGAGQAHNALDAARAVARLGAARGVRAFTRYGYIERNGQANLAVPLGRFVVHNEPKVALLDEIDGWVDSLRRASRGAGAPASLGRVVRRIEAAMLAVCRGSSAERFQRVLMELVEAEDLLLSRPKATAEAHLQPIARLSYKWIEAADDGHEEVRLAQAIASQTGPGDARSARAFGSIRAHCLPLDADWGFRRFAVSGEGLSKSPRVVWTGRDLVGDLGRVAMRRLVEAEQVGVTGFPLHGRAFAGLDDIGAFLSGAVDEVKVGRLARAFMAVDWPTAPRAERPQWTARPMALHALFRLVYAPGEVGGFSPRRDPAPLRLLLSGRLEDAARAAVHRLVSGGVRPKLRLSMGSAALAQRLSASVAIPVHPEDLLRLLGSIRKPVGETSLPGAGTEAS